MGGEKDSGNYFLKAPLKWHFCNMEKLGECGSNGWTLAMNVDGNKVRTSIYLHGFF